MPPGARTTRTHGRGTARSRFVRVLNLLRQTDEGASLFHDLLDHVIRNERRFVRGMVWDPASARGVVNEHIRRVSTFNGLGRFKAVFRRYIRRHLPDAMRRIGIRSFGNPKIEMHITASSDGDHFRRHRDTHRGGTRVVSFVYYFYRAPRRFSGGELRLGSRPAAGQRLDKDRRTVTLSPLLDSIVFFPSLTEHEVLRVRVPSRAFADNRFTITGWIHRRRK